MVNKMKSYRKWIKENENKWLIFGISVIVLAIASPFIIWLSSGYILSSGKFDNLGTFGDYLAGTTVGLLSLASVLFIISTIVMQRKELELQREELKVTNEELKRANSQYEITHKTMMKQQFESTFFNLLELLKKTRNDIEVNIPSYDLVDFCKGNEDKLYGIPALKYYAFKISNLDEPLYGEVIYDYLMSADIDFDSLKQDILLAIDYLKFDSGYDEDLSYFDSDIEEVINLEGKCNFNLLSYKGIDILSEVENYKENVFINYIKSNKLSIFSRKNKIKFYELTMYNQLSLLSYIDLIIFIINFIKENVPDKRNEYFGIFTLQFSLIELDFLQNINKFDYKGVKDLFEEVGMFNNMLSFEEERKLVIREPQI